MIARALGIVTALIVTCIALIGIAALIAMDFVSGDALAKVWEGLRVANRARVEKSELAKARDFSFFTSEKVKGHDFEVTTGVRFATLSDLLAGRQQSRWCYVVLQPSGGLPRQIHLAHQSGTDPPVFSDLSSYPEAEIRALGVSAATLKSLAREHCRTCCAEGKTA